MVISKRKWCIYSLSKGKKNVKFSFRTEHKSSPMGHINSTQYIHCQNIGTVLLSLSFLNNSVCTIATTETCAHFWSSICLV